MQNNKKLLLTTFVVVGMLAMMAGVMATTTLNVPVTGANYTTITFNVTTDIANALSCSIYYDAAGGVATTLLGSITNDTVSQTDFTELISIEALSDASTYNITANCTGDTDEAAAAVEGVTIDNTAATVSINVLKNSISAGRVQELTWTSSDATSGLDTVTVTVTSPNTDKCPVQTWSTTSGTNQQINTEGGVMDCVGTYTATITATDLAGNSATSSQTYKASDANGGTKGLGGLGTSLKGARSEGINPIVIIVALIFIYFLFVKKKK